MRVRRVLSSIFAAPERRGTGSPEMVKRLLLALTLSPVAVCHASPASDSLHAGLFLDPELAPPLTYAAGKRLADLNVGEPRTLRLFYFLPNDRPFRPEVVQRVKEEILHIQTWYGQQMEAHGHGYKTFRIETDDEGDPVVHRVDGQHPDSHYLDSGWNAVQEIAGTFDLSQSIVGVVVDNSTNRLGAVVGRATWGGKSWGAALVTGGYSWKTLAHELAHIFAQAGHDYRSEKYILSYSGPRGELSACSAEAIAVHPYFNPDVGLEWSGENPIVQLLSATTYPEGAESVPIRLRVSDADGLQLVRLYVRTGRTHQAFVQRGGEELKSCRGLMGAEEAVVEIEYDGVIPSGPAFSDLSDPRVHPIFVQVVDRNGNLGGSRRFDLWVVSRQHLATFALREGIRGVAFASGGTALASASAGGVKLWDPETGRHADLAGRGDVTAVALSAHGATLASGSTRGQIQLLDLERDRVIATLSGHARPIRSLAFSPGGTVLASGASDGIRLWDVATQTRTAALPVGVTSLAFSPDGATLASASEDGVRLWDVETQVEIASYAHSGDRWGPGVNTVAFSPDGTLVASGGNDTTVRLWDVATGETAAVLEGHGRPVRSVAFSVGGNQLASGADLAVILWDPRTKEKLVTLQGEGRGVATVAFSPDGTTLAAGAEDGKIGLWDVSEWLEPRPRSLRMVSGDDQETQDGDPLAPLVVEVRDQYGHPLPGVDITFTVTRGEGQVGDRFTQQTIVSDPRGRAEAVLTPGPGENAVEVSVEGLEVVTFHSSGTATPPVVRSPRLWPLPYGAANRLGKGWLARGHGTIAFAPSGQLLAVGTENGGIWLYDVAALQEVAWLPAPIVLGLAFSPDGQTVASCADWWDPGIRLWDVATGNQIAAIDQGAWDLVFSPDGRTLASGSNHGIELWELETGTQVASASWAEGIWEIESVAFSPDGSTLAAGSGKDYSVTLWDVATFTRTATLEGHGDRVTAVAFSPDGRTVASASWDHTVRLWDVATESNVATFDGHPNWVYSLSFSPDGRTVASGSSVDPRDGQVHLWDVATGQEVTLEGHRGRVVAVAFSKDGTVAAGSRDGTVRLWDVATRSATTLSRQHFSAARGVALSPDGTTLATALPGYAVQLWDAATGANIAELEGHTSRLNAVAYSPDGTTLASGASDRTVMLWDLRTSTRIATLETPSYVTAVAFSSDGRQVASGHANHTTTVWDVATREEIASFGGHNNAVGFLSFSPDGSTLATASWPREGEVDPFLFDGRVRLWDLRTGDDALNGEKLSPDKQIHAVSFAPDGTALALGWASGMASIWEVPAGADAATLVVEYPAGRVDAAAFSPDGSLILSGSRSDGSVVVQCGTLRRAPCSPPPRPIVGKWRPWPSLETDRPSLPVRRTARS